MISIHDWRMAHNEATGEPITTDNKMEPDEEDWTYYHTKIQGNAKRYLNWFLEEIEGKNLSLVRKGFIMQEVMNALGMTVGQYVRVTANIRRAMQKRDRMAGQDPNAPNDPGANPAPGTPSPVSTGQTPPANPAPGTPTAPASTVAQTPPANTAPGMDRTNPAGMKPPYQPNKMAQPKWKV